MIDSNRISRFRILCAASAFLAPAAHAAVDIAADNPLIRYGGRWDMADPKKPRCDWPGTYVQAGFSGTSITVKISGGKNDFNVIIDGIWKSKLTVDGKTSQVAALGLTPGTHTLLLAKRTEGFNGIATFEGFQLEDGQALSALPAPSGRRIQFIGDSFTAGYGAEATVTNCPDKRPFDNAYVAYGPVSAREVDAEYSVQAVSGLGMVHNYGDNSPLSASPMPPYYEKTLFGEQTKWDFSRFQPDIVCIALGTNDFSTSVRPTQVQYSGAYKVFVAKLRGWHPKARIMLLSYAVDSYQEKYVAALAAELIAAGESNLEHVKLPGVAAGEMGCDSHPNVAAHRKFADALLPAIQKYYGSLKIAAPSRLAGKPGISAPATGWSAPWKSEAGEFSADARGRLLTQ
jgi:lysophospholipase L1-like esterase